MCRAAASVSRTASAAQTPESMPPLNNTTDRGFSPATPQHPFANEICLSCDGGSGRNSCTMIYKLSQNFQGLKGLKVALSTQHSAFSHRSAHPLDARRPKAQPSAVDLAGDCRDPAILLGRQ